MWDSAGARNRYTKNKLLQEPGYIIPQIRNKVECVCNDLLCNVWDADIFLDVFYRLLGDICLFCTVFYCILYCFYYFLFYEMLVEIICFVLLSLIWFVIWVWFLFSCYCSLY